VKELSVQSPLKPSQNKPLTKRSAKLTYSVLTLASLAFLWIAWTSAKHQSITVDEVVHIPAGLSYLQQHDARMNVEHPPLIKVLAALPLTFEGIQLDYSRPEWQQTFDAHFGEEEIPRFGAKGRTIIDSARAPMILLTLALGLATFFLAKNIAGIDGGILSFLMFVSTPFFYAYGSLVHTDIGIALFALISVWTFASLWSDPNWANCLRFASCLAAALLTKFTAGLLFPCFLILIGWAVWRNPEHRKNWKARLRYSLLGVIFSAVAVYLCYLLLFWNANAAQILSYRFQHSRAPVGTSMLVANFLEAHPALQHLLSPIVLYFLGVAHTLHMLPRMTFLLGSVYPHGTPWYFPTLFALKMPLAYLILSFLLAVLSVWSFRGKHSALENWVVNRPRGLHLSAVVVTLIVYSLAAIASPINLGIRHFSVPIAALTVLLGLAVPFAGRLPKPMLRRGVLIAVILALAGNIVAMASAYPYFIPYFNSLAGNQPKFQIAVDSNLDWSQELVDLERFQLEHPDEKLAFDLKGSIPSLYIPEAVPFNCEEGIPAGVDWVAIGATRFVAQHQSEQIKIVADPATHCRFLFRYPFIVKSGGAAYVFHVAGAQAKNQNRAQP
jgi:4-amino-4-deoxy-L-arabinose transferase-like glycosyltransferase